MPDTALLKQLSNLIDQKIAEWFKTHGIVVPRATGTVANFASPTAAPLAALSQQAQSAKPVTLVRESRVIEGFHLVATIPPTDAIVITNKRSSSMSDIINRGISNGVYQEFHGEVRVNLNAFMGAGEPRIVYVSYDNGALIGVARPTNKMILGKVVLLDGSVAIRDDRDPDSLDGYIVMQSDPFFDNTVTMDDDTIAAFKNTLQVLLAENIYGTITLSDALNVLSADGSTKLTGGGLTILDSNANILAKFTKQGIFFYDTSGRMLATFGPNNNSISALDILDEKTLAIRDNNEVTRVLLGMLQLEPKQTWGFEMYDERGKVFMSTTKNRAFFTGARIVSRLLAVPMYAMLFGMGACVSGIDPNYIGINELDESSYSSYQKSTIDLSPLSTSLQSFAFDGDKMWTTVYDTSIDNPHLVKINILDASYESVYLGDNFGAIRRELCFAKNRMWFAVYDNSVTDKVKIYSVNLNDFNDMTLGYIDDFVAVNGLVDFLVYDGSYLYLGWRKNTTTSLYLQKFSINSDFTLSVVKSISHSGIAAAYTLFNNYLWIFNSTAHKMCKIDLNTLERTLGPEDPSRSMYRLASDGIYLWGISVVTGEPDSLTKIDPDDMSYILEVPLGHTSMWGLIFDGKHFWIIKSGIMQRVDPINNAISGTFDLSNAHYYVGYDGLNLWTNNDAGMIQRTPISE